MLLEFADLTLTGKGQLYIQLYDYIKGAVEKGVLKKGEKLPSVREAALQLGVSRTTVENAYSRLCIEGYCEGLPQRGYFINTTPKKTAQKPIKAPPTPEINYDFSSRFIDAKSSDTELWKKIVRSVLWDSGELNSYGHPQGEKGLREALADYSYKARGVVTDPENIVIGAGVGPLLNILCGLLGRDITVGFESGGFGEAERIFHDYGIKTLLLKSDQSGALPKEILNTNPKLLFLLPSALSRLNQNELAKRRSFYEDWVQDKGRLIIEDDYNGELRYYARSIPAFQGRSPQETVYIGSFSKLLLPSVRIAYMVLPDLLAEKFRSVLGAYNQTCGKIEQLALEKYIVTGALEKHLRKLRRLYYAKSQCLLRELENNFHFLKAATLFESSLTVEIKTTRNFSKEDFCTLAQKEGFKAAAMPDCNTLRLCFAGIDKEKIPEATVILNKIFTIL